MNPITFDRQCYRVNGEPLYLNSGEVHYFRVPKDDWARRLELLKEAGGNCVATYIPWLIHEPEEGRFVFDAGDGVTDLEAFITTAREQGLSVIARPGPYQYSELVNDGLASWLFDKYPEIRALNISGKPLTPASASYLHPAFLEKTRNWFEKVCAILAKHTVSKGGPIVFTQLDNELAGIHVWRGSLDYHPEVMGFGKTDGRYTRFLREKYGEVKEMNRLYGTKVERFEELVPSADWPRSVPGERRRRDYFDFYRSTIAEYCAKLAEMLRASGVDTPLMHNSANPAMNAYFPETVEALGSDLVLGSDHYYNLGQNWRHNNPSPQELIQKFTSLEMLRMLGSPPTVLEMPGGSPWDWPPITATDLKAWYWAHLALGMKGHNYYVFTGGTNPPGAGSFGSSYDYQAAIGAKGEVRPLYEVQKEFGTFIANRPWLAEAEREYDCRIGLAWDAAHAGTGQVKDPPDVKEGRQTVWEFTQKGLLNTAFCAGLSPVLCDLDSDDWIEETDTPVLVPTSTVVPTARQERMVEFLKRGGKLVMGPVFPKLNEKAKRCMALKEYLNVEWPKQSSQPVLLNVDGVDHITGSLAFMTKNVPENAEIIGRTATGDEVTAWQINLDGGGKIVWLGLRWIHGSNRQARMLQALLSRLGLQNRVTCSNPNVWTSLRTAGTRSLLFLMNLNSSAMEAEVRCRPAWSDTDIDLGTRRLDAMSVTHVDLTESM